MNAARESLPDRELDVAREVAHALLTAATSLEVYRLALARLSPLVRARFSSIFESDPADPSLLKLTCAHNWPQASARYLGHLRVRVGRGPTGITVAESRVVEVPDVFADPALREWWEPARELGFVSLISLPLRGSDGTAGGALTLYFDGARDFTDDERHLLTLIADLLGVAAESAAAQDSVRKELERLRRENQLLRERIGAGDETKRLNDEFLANISHELRTPLNSILGYASLLSGGQTGELPDAQRNAVARIERSAHVLLHLISDLLELSQVKLGRATLSLAPDDAVLLARRALEGAGPPPDSVHIELHTSAERIPLMTDGEKVVKVLENLISNAFKFTPAGTVRVSVNAISDEEGRGAVEWTVSDTGVGIAHEQQDAIFDEFRQVDGSSTRLYGGTGLGLALCRALARLLRGRIMLRSELGRGAEFRLVVPDAASADHPA